jgi:hypothetical protein
MTSKNNQGNTVLRQILLDLAKVLNQPFTRRVNQGDKEISAATKRLGGLLVQPTSINTNQYDAARGYFLQNGATEEAATNLALLVANISKISGRTIGEVIRELEDAEGITFDEGTYIQINSLRSRENQWFKARPTPNDEALVPLALCQCAEPTFFMAVAGDQQVTLQWGASTSTVLQYSLEWSFDQTTWTPLFTADSGTFSYVHTGLAFNTTYYYRIVSICSTCRSTYLTANATTPEEEAIPYHEWQMGEDLGAVLFDTGTITPLVPVEFHVGNPSYAAINRNINTYVQNSENTTYSSYEVYYLEPDSTFETLIDTGSDFTLSIWVRPFDTKWFENFSQTVDTSIVSYDDFGTSYGYLRHNNFGRNISILDYESTYNSVPPDIWTHVGVVVTNLNQLSIYINGVLDSQYTTRYSLQRNLLGIGNAPQFTDAFVGYLNHMRLYEQALSSQDISDLYNSYTRVYNSTQETNAEIKLSPPNNVINVGKQLELIPYISSGLSGGVKNLYLSPDGYHLFVISNDDGNIYKIKLETANEVDTGSFEFNNLRVYDTNVKGNFSYNLPTNGDFRNTVRSGFHSSGNYVAQVGVSENEGDGLQSEPVYMFQCQSPWDLKNAQLIARAILAPLVPQGTPPGLSNVLQDVGDFRFSSDGTFAYALDTDNANDLIVQFACGTAYDITTLSYHGVSPDSISATPERMFFKPDGTKLFILDISVGLKSFTMSVAWDISTIVDDANDYAISEDSNPTSFFFRSDGTKLYIAGRTNDRVYQYTLSTPWDITTITYDSVSSSVVSQGIEFGSGLDFKDDGTKMFLDVEGGTVQYIEYNLTVAWDVSSAVENIGIFDPSEDTDPEGVYVDPTGTTLWVSGDTNNTIYQYSMSTAWDLTTISYDSVSLSVGSETTAPRGIYVKPDGTKLYLLGSAGFVYQYSLPTPWDLTAASYDSISFNAGLTSRQNVEFKSDGTEMYISGDSRLISYSLSTPWDLTTASVITDGWGLLGGTFNYSDARGIVHSNDGTNLFVARPYANIRQYSVTPAWQPRREYRTYVNFDGGGQHFQTMSRDGLTVSSVYANEESGHPGPAELIIIYRKNGSDWPVYATIDVLAGHHRFSYDGLYLFVGVGADTLVYEDQLNGTYALLYTIAGLNADRTMTVSDDGTVLCARNGPSSVNNPYGIYRKSGATWVLEDTLYGKNAHVSNDGTRVIVATGWIEPYYQGEAGIHVWEYTGSQWDRVHVATENETMRKLSIHDGYAFKISLSSGLTDTATEGGLTTNDDGTACAWAVVGGDTFAVPALFGIEAAYIAVMRELSPGNWTYPNDIRIPFPMPNYAAASTRLTRVEGQYWAYMSGDGDRIVTMHYDSDFTKGGPSGRGFVYDWNAIAGEYEFVGAISPTLATYGDRWGEDSTLSADGTTFLTWSEYWGFFEGSNYHYGDVVATRVDDGIPMMRLYDLGAIGSKSKYSYRNPNFTSFDPTADPPYKDKPVFYPVKRYLNSFDGGGTAMYGRVIVRNSSVTLSSVNISTLGHATGKKYAEFYYTGQRFLAGTSSARMGLIVIPETENMNIINSAVYQNFGTQSYDYAYDISGLLWNNNSSVATTAASSGTTIGIAVDCDTGKVWFALNNSWLSGDPVAGTGESFTMSLTAGDYIRLAVGELAGIDDSWEQTRVQLNVVTEEFTYTPPSGFSEWEPNTQADEYGYSALVNFYNPVAYWKFSSAPGGIVSDEIATNDITLSGGSGLSTDYGFSESGSMYFGNEAVAYGDLQSEVVFTQSQEFTLSFLLFMREPAANYSHDTILMESSDVGVDGSGFEIGVRGEGGNLNGRMYIRSYDDIGSDRTYYFNVMINYQLWNHVAIFNDGSGAMTVVINGVEATYDDGTFTDLYGNVFSFMGSAGFGLKNIGSRTSGQYPTYAYVTEVAIYGSALNELGEPITNSGYNGFGTYYKLLQLCYAAVRHYSTLNYKVNPSTWTESDPTTNTYLTQMRQGAYFPTTAIVSDAPVLSFTTYAPPGSYLATYTFDADNDGDEAAFTWEGLNGNGLQAETTPGYWNWHDGATANPVAGPSSGQGGVPDGYVYTNTQFLGGTSYALFTATLNDPIDTLSSPNIVIEFYTNQKGFTFNTATCQLQVSVNGMEWMDLGPLLGGASDPERVIDPNGADNWAYRTQTIDYFTQTLAIRWVVELTSSPIAYSEYGLDTITITGSLLTPPTIPSAINQWLFDSETGGVVSDNIGTNDLTFTGTGGNLPVIDTGVMYVPFDAYNDARGTLDTEIVTSWNDTYTIMGWVYIRPDPDPTGYYGVIWTSQDALSGIVDFFHDSSPNDSVEMNFYSHDGTSGKYSIATLHPPVSAWVHVALVGHGDNTFTLYLNGVEGVTDTYAGTNLTTHGLYNIGSDGAGNVAHAYFEDFRYYNQELTQQQVSYIAATEEPGAPPIP